MLIDAHTHVFPDALAPRAIASLSLTAKIKPSFDGTVGGLIALMKKEGVDKSIILNVSTNERQVENVNKFALATKEKYSTLIPFCSLHPLTPEPKKKIREFIASGIKGLKLHPDYVGIPLDDERMRPLLSAAAEEGLPVVIHAGFDPISPSKMHASPEAIIKVLGEFSGITLIAAHLGGAHVWDVIPETLCGRDLYFDTSFCCERTGCTPEAASRIFENHPIEKFLFGSDAPWATPTEVLKLLSDVGISGEDFEKVSHKNAEKLFGIE